MYSHIVLEVFFKLVSAIKFLQYKFVSYPSNWANEW